MSGTQAPLSDRTANRALSALEEIYFKAWSEPDDKAFREYVIHRCIDACRGTPWEVGA